MIDYWLNRSIPHKFRWPKAYPAKQRRSKYDDRPWHTVTAIPYNCKSCALMYKRASLQAVLVHHPPHSIAMLPISYDFLPYQTTCCKSPHMKRSSKVAAVILATHSENLICSICRRTQPPHRLHVQGTSNCKGAAFSVSMPQDTHCFPSLGDAYPVLLSFTVSSCPRVTALPS